MRQEDIEVRITRSGEVFVTIKGSTEQRIRDYRQFFEDMIGPVVSFNRIDRPDWDKPATLSAEEEEKRRREEELRLR